MHCSAAGEELSDMKTNITAKNMVVTPGITNRITKKTATMEKYLKPDTEMNVRLRREADRRICEITVPLEGGVTLRAESANQDNLFMSIDSALAKIERQILRHRTKLERSSAKALMWKSRNSSRSRRYTAKASARWSATSPSRSAPCPWRTRRCRWNCSATASSCLSISKPTAPTCCISVKTATWA